MRIHLIFIGKTGFPDLESAIDRYKERLGHYCRIQIHYVKAEKITAATPEETVRLREGDRIMKLIGQGGNLIALDPAGRELDSPGLARLLGKLIESGASDLWMVVGGPVGIAEQVLKNSREVLSLSKMTFPHDLARLMLVEQLYRAFTILKGEPYHK